MIVRTDAFYRELDEGIRYAVRTLHDHVIETCQSCEGGPTHRYPEPTIELPNESEGYGFRATDHLVTAGIQVSEIALVWRTRNGVPYDAPFWRLTLRKPATGNATGANRVLDDITAHVAGTRCAGHREGKRCVLNALHAGPCAIAGGEGER